MAGVDMGGDISIVFRPNGRPVRLSTVAKWRRAISSRDLTRDTDIELEIDGRSQGLSKAGDVAALQPLFEELTPATSAADPLSMAAEASENLPALVQSISSGADSAGAPGPASDSAAADPAVLPTSEAPQKPGSADGQGAVPIAGAGPAKPLPSTGTSDKAVGCLSLLSIAVVVILALWGLITLLPHRSSGNSAALTTPTTIQMAPAVPAPVAPAPTPTPPALADVSTNASTAVLEGRWASQGLTCEDAIVISAAEGVLTIVAAGQTHRATVAQGSAAGVFDVKDDDGAYSYQADNNQLMITDPNGRIFRFSKCPAQ